MSEQAGKCSSFFGEGHGNTITLAALEKALQRANLQVNLGMKEGERVEEVTDKRCFRSAQLESGQVERVLSNAEDPNTELHACIAHIERSWTMYVGDLDVEMARRVPKGPYSADLVRAFQIYDIRYVFPNDELCAAYHAAALTYNSELNNINPALPPLMKRTEKLTSVGDECHVYVGPTPAFAAVSDDSAKCPSATYLFRSGPVFVKMHVSDGTLVVDPTPRQKELAIDPKGPGVNREWQGTARR